MKEPIRIAVTGGAGQIAYSLLFRLAAGELFHNQPIALHILEVPAVLSQLEGVKMELLDCAFPHLQEIVIGSDPHKVFEGVNFAYLVGAKPRGPGMERKDLLEANGRIFQGQGQALSDAAAKDVRVLVVGNPCNTNCLIAIHNAKNIAPQQFQAMTRLDENRAKAFLAVKAQCPVSSITNCTIWGNHSSTQVPDFLHTKIDGKLATEVIKDTTWLQTEFFKKVQGRGAEIIQARGKSSAASAASAAIDAMRSLITADSTTYSSAVYSANNSYGIDPNLVFSFPCKSVSKGNWEEVKGVEWDQFLETKIRASEKELIEERDLIKDLL
ncbi:MAG: mdh [Chlamydiia bacterium]|nr:mdh [Chlamydiia bacterium]